MTIFSVPAGAATADPRQLKIVGNPELVKQDPTLKLETGAWSAISWEFTSLLRALLPDAPAEPVSSGLEDDKGTSEEPGTSQAAESPEASGLLNTGKIIATALNSDPLGILKNTVTSWQGHSQRAWYPGANLGPVNSGNDDTKITPSPQVVRALDAVVALAAGPKTDSVALPQDPASETSSPLPPQTLPYVRIVPRVNVATRPPADPKNTSVIEKADPAAMALLNNISDSKLKDPVGGDVPLMENESETKPVPPAPILVRNSVSTSTAAAPVSIHSGTWQIAAQQNVVIRPFAGAAPPCASARAAEADLKSPLFEAPERGVDGAEKQNASETAIQAISTQVPSDVARPVTTNAIRIPEVAAAASPTRVEEPVDNEPASHKSTESSDQPAGSMPAAVSSQPLPQLDAKDLKPSQREKSPTNVVARIPEKRDDERSEQNPAGLFSVQEKKATALSITDIQGPPPPSLGKPAVIAEQFATPESTSKGDKPSPNSVVAFTGRLTPKSASQEPASQPALDRPIETKSEKLPVSSARGLQEVLADRQAHLTAEVGRDHPIVRNESGAVFSDIARDVAPLSANRPPEPGPSTRSAFSEFVHEPSNRETSGPLREISMRFTDSAQDSAHLHVVEKGGEVLVSVRSGSEQLARTLNSDLGELSHRLEQTGFQTELYRPAAQSPSNETGHQRRDSASDAGQHTNQSWSRERRDSQQHSGQGTHEWIEDLEESMGLS